MPLDVRLFYGRTDEALESDEVSLPCGDGFGDLFHKTREIFKWALAHGYDYVFKTDDDVFVRPDKLLEEFKPVDYRGFPVRYLTKDAEGVWASGIGYWVSRKAMHTVLDGDDQDITEDRAVGLTLAKAGIKLEEVANDVFMACPCEHCPGDPSKATIIHLEQREQRIAMWAWEHAL